MPAELKPYMYRCVRNAVIDVHRRQKFRDDRPVETCESVQNQLDPNLVTDLESCLAQLAPDEQEILHLKFFGGLTLREIAVIRDETKSRVNSRYTRSLKKMKELYDDVEI